MDLLSTGAMISLLGVGLVFALLAILWGLAAALLRLERAAEPAAPAAAAPASAQTNAAAGQPALPPALVTAIATAVLAYRASQRKQAAPSTRSYQPGALLHASRWVAAGRTRQNRSWLRRRE